MAIRRSVVPLIFVVVFTSCYSVPGRPVATNSQSAESSLVPMSKTPAPKRSTPKAPPENFRGIVWGRSLAKVPGMVLLKNNEATGTKMYSKQGDNLAIGDAALTSITYFAFQDRFSSVMVRSKGYTNWSNLRRAVFAKYGRGVQDNPYIEDYDWVGGTTTRSLDYNEITEEATLWMADTALMVMRDRYEKERAEAAARNDF